MLEIRLFGEPRFVFEGKPWHFSAPPRTLPLLSYLILHAGEQISRSRLAAIMWPDELDDTARANLRRHLHYFARALPPVDGEPWLLLSKGGISWNERAFAWVDVHEFKRLAAAQETRAQAIELYSGDLLETMFDEWVLAERGRYQSAALSTMHDLVVEARSRRSYREAIAHAERMLAVDEWREDALRGLMSARYESGDRSAALALYERFSLRLHAEMQVGPMPETTALRDLIVAEVPLALSDDIPNATVPESASRSLLPFVGRAEALETLRATWMRAARKTGSLVFIVGEPGIGKSRLAAELSATVDSQGGRALVGLTSSPERMPYQPLVDAIRRGLPYIAKTAIEPIWLSVIASLVPEVLGLRAGLHVAEAIEPKASRTRLHEAFVRIFECMARARPLLIVLEDLHWAQADTIDALSFIARRLGALPILIVAVYRDESLECTHPLLDARRALQGERRATAVTLSPLDARDIERLVERMHDGADAPTGVAEAVFRLSEGNPLFASQLLESFAETGTIPDENGSLPKLAATIAARVDRLEPSVRSVADVAATIGRDFSAELVCSVGGWKEDAVLDALGTLMDRHLVRETGGTGFEYCFTHILISNAIYERTEKSLRAKRHRRIAQALSRIGSERNTFGTIALHYEQAGDPESAGRAYIDASSAALAVFAVSDAIALARRALRLVVLDRDCYDAALAILKARVQGGESAQMDADVTRFEEIAAGLGRDERFEALDMRHKQLRIGSSDLDRQRDSVDRLMELAKASNDPRKIIRALEARAQAFMYVGNVGGADAPLREAMEIAATLDDHHLDVRLRRALIFFLIRHGDSAAALHELGTLREMLQQFPPNGPEQLYRLSAEATCAGFVEDEAMCERVGREMLEVSQNVGDLESEARARALLGHAAHQRFECSVMRKHFAAAIAIFESRQLQHAVSVSFTNLGWLEREIGNLEEATRLWKASEAISRELDNTAGLASNVLNLGEAEFVRGNTDEAFALVQAALVHAQKSGERRFIVEALMVLGAIECARGASEIGIPRMRAAVAERRGLETPRALVDELCALAEVLLETGKHDEATALGAELAELFERAPDRQRYPTRICLALSNIRSAEGDVDAATRWRLRGAEILTAQLARFDDPADVERFSGLPFNRRLLNARPSGRGTRTGRRSL